MACLEYRLENLRMWTRQTSNGRLPRDVRRGTSHQVLASSVFVWNQEQRRRSECAADTRSERMKYGTLCVWAARCDAPAKRGACLTPAMALAVVLLASLRLLLPLRGLALGHLQGERRAHELCYHPAFATFMSVLLICLGTYYTSVPLRPRALPHGCGETARFSRHASVGHYRSRATCKPATCKTSTPAPLDLCTHTGHYAVAQPTDAFIDLLQHV